MKNRSSTVTTESVDFLAGAGADLDRVLAECKPEIDGLDDLLADLPQDDRPMRERHAEMGRLLQKVGLQYFYQRGKRPPKVA